MSRLDAPRQWALFIAAMLALAAATTSAFHGDALPWALGLSAVWILVVVLFVTGDA